MKSEDLKALLKRAQEWHWTSCEGTSNTALFTAKEGSLAIVAAVDASDQGQQSSPKNEDASLRRYLVKWADGDYLQSLDNQYHWTKRQKDAKRLTLEEAKRIVGSTWNKTRCRIVSLKEKPVDLFRAEEAYLHQHGWEEHDGLWKEPSGRLGRMLGHDHAVNSEKYRQRCLQDEQDRMVWEDDFPDPAGFDC